MAMDGSEELSQTQSKRPKLDSNVRNAIFDSSSSDADSGSDTEDFSADVNLIIWQETQIAECVIDNTVVNSQSFALEYANKADLLQVNRVMESYRNILRELDELGADLPDDVDEEEDEAEQREGAGGGHVEESAILMAITEHGLHQSNDQEGDDEDNRDSVESNSNSGSADTPTCSLNERNSHPGTTSESETSDLNFLAISTAIHSKGLSPTQSIQIPPHR